MGPGQGHGLAGAGWPTWHLPHPLSCTILAVTDYPGPSSPERHCSIPIRPQAPQICVVYPLEKGEQGWAYTGPSLELCPGDCPKVQPNCLPWANGGVRRQREGGGEGGGRRGRLGGRLGAAGPGGECLPFLNLCPHSRDLPPTRKGKLKASPSDHVNAAQRWGIRGRAPWGEAGGGGVAMWPCSSSEDRKAAVSCFRYRGPWELLSWQEAAAGSGGFMWLGGSHVGP